ncbi:hypothetical protein PV327_010348 [Microctonus hyperodae]|uniref:CUB domain-containing protein n=1 Tax=Microctonus hyperodae TaxID=165561 RepID=A0AA39FSB4_MICHY|nr:hypothetical protein PV327_010348 [Microctonus hyperodae]
MSCSPVTGVNPINTDNKVTPEWRNSVSRNRTAKSSDTKMNSSSTNITSRQKILESPKAISTNAHSNKLSRMSNSDVQFEKAHSVSIDIESDKRSFGSSILNKNQKLDKTVSVIEKYFSNIKEQPMFIKNVNIGIPTIKKLNNTNRIAFQSVPSQSAIAKIVETHLTNGGSLRSSKVTSPTTITDEEFTQKLPRSILVTRIEEKDGSVARAIDATTTFTTTITNTPSNSTASLKTTEENPSQNTTDVQLDPALAVGTIDATDSYLPSDSPIVESEMHSDVVNTSSRSFQFQSQSNRIQTTSVSDYPFSRNPKLVKEKVVNQSSTNEFTNVMNQLSSPTQSTSAFAYQRRFSRDASKNACEKFEIGDNVKREFYSPNYPQNYPTNIDCVKILEAHGPLRIVKVVDNK